MTIDPQVRPSPQLSAPDNVDARMRARETAWKERRQIERAWSTFLAR